MYLGSVMGSMEQWLGVRSLRTLELRVTRQSKTAEALVKWIAEGMQGDDVVRKVVGRVQHASLQTKDLHWIKEQMPGGYGPVFSLMMRDMQTARALPGKLKLFHHATSLGGVESLIEWRRMSDAGVDEKLVRISVGVENWEDLREDLYTAFKALVEV